MTKTQRKFTEMYKLLIQELDKTNIKWVLHAGNALGAVRGGGWIPWDDDLDIAIDVDSRQEVEDFFKDNEHFNLSMPFQDNRVSVFYKLYSKEYTYTRKRNGKLRQEPLWIDVFTIYNREKPKRGAWNDFWTHFLFARCYVEPSKMLNILKSPLKLIPLSVFKRILLKKYKVSKGQYSYEDARYNKPLDGCDFSKIKYVEFEGIKSPVFEDVDKYFETRYGDGWRIPHTESERWKHRIDDIDGTEEETT